MSQVLDRARNGVDTQQMYGTLDAIKADPSLGRFQFSDENANTVRYSMPRSAHRKPTRAPTRVSTKRSVISCPGCRNPVNSVISSAMGVTQTLPSQ